MTKIALDPIFIPLVEDKVKRQTARPNRRDIPLGNAVLEAGDRDLNIEVTSVTYKTLGSVTHEEVLLDGFKNINELLKALRVYYPDISLNDEMTLIGFDYIG